MNSNETKQLPAAAPADSLDGVLREVKCLQQAYARANTMRIGVLLGAIIIVATIGLLAWGEVRAFSSEANLKKLADEASLRIEKNQDFYMRELETLSNQVSPMVSKAFMDQAKKDMPTFVKALEKQRGPLAENLQKKFAEKLSQRSEKIKPDLEKILVKEFPQLKNKQLQEAMVGNLAQALDLMIRKYYVEDMQKEIVTVFETWDAFPAAPPPSKIEAPLEDQFLGALIDLLTYKLTHHGDQEILKR